MFGTGPVRDFVTYFGTGNEFLDFLFDMWNEHVPMYCKYENN